jgi:hypothetical protein
MSRPPTARDYLGLHTVHAFCVPCNRPEEIDLAALIEAGYGDTPLIELPLRCAECGHRGHRILVSGDPTPAHRRKQGR